MSQLSSKQSISGSSFCLSARPATSRPCQKLVVQALKSKVKYDKEKSVDSPVSAFTRRREVFAGRLAMSGFVAALAGEFLTGRGALGQLQLETRLPQQYINYGVLGIVAFNFITALAPGSPTFSPDNQADVKKRPSGPTNKPSKFDPTDPPAFFGTSRAFGFTKKNELFVGRVAMLGFASELLGEIQTGGKGPLGQIGVPLDPKGQQYAGVALALWIGVFLVAAIGFNKYGQQEGNEEIY
ncbi:hypothetical protein WJX74_007623 [Apatococcus lobatus]|uniref:Uncharacterized protein n=1 Tax=Apatococcus lobatus TaxID=904363 RepID=A0AAW1S7F1_9CHLO